MCLNKVLTDTDDGELDDRGKGFKVMRRTLSGNYYTPIFRTAVKKNGVWNAVKYVRRKTLEATNGDKYAPGFHIYTNLESTRAWTPYDYSPRVVAEVEYKDAVCEGVEGVGRNVQRVVVAKKINVLRELTDAEYHTALVEIERRKERRRRR